MKKRTVIFCCLWSFVAPGATNPASPASPELVCPEVVEAVEGATPNADAILAAVVARLPQEPLSISGELIARKARGVVLHAYRFEMDLNWGAIPALAHYTIDDAFGSTLEQFTLIRQADGRLEFRYAAGDPPLDQPAPPMDRRIQSTDLSWTDLTLAFLWWPGGQVVGEDSIRGRACRIIEVPAPPGAATTADAANPPYAKVRIWVDAELFLLLQAEAFDAKNVRVRRLWVRSIKKQNERWMIKDLEVQAYPPVQRTRLHVRDVADTAMP